MITKNSLSDMEMREYYNNGKFGNNTPEINQIFKDLTIKFDLWKIKGNGNGTMKQAERLYKILKNAK